MRNAAAPRSPFRSHVPIVDPIDVRGQLAAFARFMNVACYWAALRRLPGEEAVDEASVPIKQALEQRGRDQRQQPCGRRA
jgi:hypothetical protein